MNSLGSTEHSEGYPRTGPLATLPRSGRPIALPPPDDHPATHTVRHLGPLAYRSAVESAPQHTMGSPRFTRPTHGYA
jgi:hypothetical protein